MYRTLITRVMTSASIPSNMEMASLTKWQEDEMRYKQLMMTAKQENSASPHSNIRKLTSSVTKWLLLFPVMCWIQLRMVVLLWLLLLLLCSGTSRGLGSATGRWFSSSRWFSGALLRTTRGWRLLLGHHELFTTGLLLLLLLLLLLWRSSMSCMMSTSFRMRSSWWCLTLWSALKGKNS